MQYKNNIEKQLSRRCQIFERPSWEVKRMTMFEVAVYVTEQEYNKNGYKSQKVINDYLYDIFGSLDDHSISVQTPDQTAVAPTEAAYNHGEFPVSDYLCSLEEKWYDWLSSWFLDWMDCHGNYDAATANVLITNYDGDLGVTAGDCCVAEGGPHIANVDSIKRLDLSDEAGYVQNVLHELGHVFIGDIPEDYNEEYMGNAEVKSGYYGEVDVYLTPMITYQDPNDCGHNNDQPPCDDAGVSCGNKQMYSDCAVRYFQ